MTITVPIHAIELTPGSTVSIHNLSWQDFETLLLHKIRNAQKLEC